MSARLVSKVAEKNQTLALYLSTRSFSEFGDTTSNFFGFVLEVSLAILHTTTSNKIYIYLTQAITFAFSSISSESRFTRTVVRPFSVLAIGIKTAIM